MKKKTLNTDSITKKNIEAYDATVEEYYEKTKNIEEAETLMQQEVISHFKKKGKILDLACGPGRDSKMFSELGFDVTGIDLSAKTIEKAKLIAPSAHFIVMDFQKLKLNSTYYDAVWFNAGLFCVPKKNALPVLQNVYDSLKKEAFLFVSVKQGTGEGFEVDSRYHIDKYYAYYSESEIQNLLKTSKFTIIKKYTPHMKSTYHEHQWLSYLCRKA